MPTRLQKWGCEMAQAAALKTPPTRKWPVVAIVGRPNVGKSTLFNKILGERKAIVGDTPGVTRDRNYGEAEWAGKRFQLIDTGGLDTDANVGLEESIQKQSRFALAEADVIVFLLDGKGGLNPSDRDAVDLLRKQQKAVFFAVNKIDSRRRSDNLYEFYALGVDPLFSISAEHGLGIPDLMDAIVEQFPDGQISNEQPEQKKARPRVAVTGRPNVGKSTLINRLLGFERSVVDATPGTTRDALDTPFELEGKACLLVDTAGIRRKARISDRLEHFSVTHSLRSVDRSDLVIYLLDGVEGATDQDAQILSYAVQRGKALILAVNKWDVVSRNGADAESYREEVYHRLSFLDFVPVLFISAATGYGVHKMLKSAARVQRAYDQKISTSVLNQVLQRMVKAHPAPLAQGKPVKFYYGTQTGSRPPTFTLFVNRPKAVPESYQRYLVHQLREDLALDSVPIQLLLRARREEQRVRKR